MEENTHSCILLHITADNDIFHFQVIKCLLNDHMGHECTHITVFSNLILTYYLQGETGKVLIMFKQYSCDMIQHGVLWTHGCYTQRGWADKATTYCKIIIPHANQTKYHGTTQWWQPKDHLF